MNESQIYIYILAAILLAMFVVLIYTVYTSRKYRAEKRKEEQKAREEKDRKEAQERAKAAQERAKKHRQKKLAEARASAELTFESTLRAKELQQQISVAQTRLEQLQHELSILELHEDFKNRETILSLIKYLEQGRADSLKEAINLYVKEKQENDRWYRKMEMDREMEKFNRQLEADQRKWQAQQAREKAIDDMFDRLDQKIQLNRIEELEKERLNEERRIRENLEKRK